MFKKIIKWLKYFFQPELIEDLFFMWYCIVWLFNNIVVLLLFDIDAVIVNNYIMIVIMGVLCFLKYTNDKIYNWFKTPLKKEE